MQNPIKHELQHIISGKGKVRFGTAMENPVKTYVTYMNYVVNQTQLSFTT
jgi:hypothetical protein